jgi:hypothetical protein
MVYLAHAHWLSCKHLLVRRGHLGSGTAHGFTLVESVLVAVISVIVLVVAARLSVNEARSAIRTYAYQSLRDQIARVTFLIEGEIAEASDLSSIEPEACVDKGPPSGVFLFAFKHQYTKSQAAADATIADATICYYNGKALGSDLYDLYRFGPKYDDQSGMLLTTASSLSLISRATDLLTMPDPDNPTVRTSSPPTVAQGLLSYYITIGRGATDSGPIWNLSYTPRQSDNKTPSLQFARVGTACMPSDSSTGCW